MTPNSRLAHRPIDLHLLAETCRPERIEQPRGMLWAAVPAVGFLVLIGAIILVGVIR